MWLQRTLTLAPHPRGYHLITDRVVQSLPELKLVQIGLLHVFNQHTSASLTVNENADPDVRLDFELATNQIVPESLPYVHTIEGPDDMPAHVKASMLGCSLMLPISGGSLNLGDWQGIYFCEHRNRATARTLILTLWGKSM